MSKTGGLTLSQSCLALDSLTHPNTLFVLLCQSNQQFKTTLQCHISRLQQQPQQTAS